VLIIGLAHELDPQQWTTREVERLMGLARQNLVEVRFTLGEWQLAKICYRQV
jgi:hypothetical protein